MNNPNANIHPASASERFLGITVSILANAAIFAMVALSSGSSETQAAPVEMSKVFCRYIEGGKLFQFDLPAPDGQAAEESVCGSQYRDVRLGAPLVEGARLLLSSPDENAILLAQRESCSCSSEDKVPILQDIGIVEAPRIGAETRKTALPRIFNAPEPTVENTISTTKSPTTKPKTDTKKPDKDTSLQDLLNAANSYDPSRPTSDVDPGGSADGSRLSNSATGKGDPYLQKVKARLDNTMNAPAGIPSAELKKLKANLTIVIGAGGVLTKWDFTKKSGNASFDKMIEMTLKQFMLTGSMRFPDPPDKFKYQMIPVVVDGSSIR